MQVYGARNRIHGIVLGICLFVIVPSVSTAQSVHETAPLDTTQFIENSCISYAVSHTFNIEPQLWERIIAHPYLFGKLWEQYGFEPKYVFHRIGNRIRLIDPTGIDGYLSCEGIDDSTRVILADGRLHGWGLPISVKGRVLFIFTYTAERDTAAVDLRLYGEGTASAADLIIRAFSPLLKYLINRRFVSNLNDAAIIIDELGANPRAIREKLPPVLYEEFDRFLSYAPPPRK